MASDLWLCLLVHVYFWAVAAVSISFQKAPMLTALYVFTAGFMFWIGYCTGWNNCTTSKLHED